MAAIPERRQRRDDPDVLIKCKSDLRSLKIEPFQRRYVHQAKKHH